MTFRDLLEISTGNLWRMKLRTTLTVSGVVIAIAAFVAMLSFGAGMQENIADRFDQFGLFSTMHVYPGKGDNANATDTSAAAPAKLDIEAIEALAALPGVNLAYPFDNYIIEVTLADSQISTKGRALPLAAIQSKLYSNLEAGVGFNSDSAKQVIVTNRFLGKYGIDEPDSALGTKIIVSVSVISLDSALAHLIYHGDIDTVKQKLRDLEFDSLLNSDYRKRIFNRELGGAIGRFMDGYLNARSVVSDTLEIVGVSESHRGRRVMQPVIFPIATGRRFSSAGVSGGQLELIQALTSGKLLGLEGGASENIDDKYFEQVTLDLDPTYSYSSISDTVQSLGFETFSYAEKFEEIQQIFLYFNMILALIGAIALVTASLGIVNTMVMSILERRREIGVLKALGADEREIRMLYLFESAMIGAAGAAGGIVLGWIIARITSAVAQSVMESKGVDPVDLFSMPIWLVLSAFAIGLTVSLIAGYYPASRAARVDPVEALRAD